MATEKLQDPSTGSNRSSHEGDGISLSEIYSTSSDLSTTGSEPPGYTPTPEIATSQDASAAATPSTSRGHLDKPIAIPAIEDSFDSPFLRAYAPILKRYGLPRESFLSFLDQLNKAISSSPPLQVLDATGGILSLIPLLFPLHWIGSAVSGLANVGSLGVSKSRTDVLLRQANRDIFGPRGLQVGISKLDALAHIAKIPILDSHGKVSRRVPLSQQLLINTQTPNTDSNANTTPADAWSELDVQQRWIKILQPWIAELQMEILPWTAKSRLTRFNTALKKRNNPGNHLREADGQPMKVHDGYPEIDGEEIKFRKCLWLIIKDIGGG